MPKATITTFWLVDPADVDELVAVIEQQQRSGRGWVNLRPDFGDNTPPAPKPSWFSGRGPILPLVSFVPGKTTRDTTHDGTTRPTMLGLEHGAGPKAVPKLREAGLAPDPAWRLRQDHGRRGIVVEVPSTSPTEPLLRWALAAAGVLCTLHLPSSWTVELWA